MSFKVPKGSGPKKDYGRVGEGTFPARVVQIIGLGVHENVNFKTGQPMLRDDGTEQPPSNKVLITYELPTKLIETDDGSKPRWMSKEYNLFFSDNAALTKVLNAAAGGSDDLEDLLAQPCLLSVGTTSGGKDKITAVSQPIEGVPVPELVNEPKIFNFDDPSLDIFNSLYEWQKDKIKGALNFEGSPLDLLLQGREYEADAKADAMTDDLPEDDIPF